MGEISDRSENPTLLAPVLLNPKHDLSQFDCGLPEFSRWLKVHALKNQSPGASRTYVLCQATHVVGYYALAAGSVQHEAAIGKARRNMPDPVPAMILGRLAVHTDWQSKGLGGDLLRDAVLRTLHAADIAGIKVILVHAISDEAKQFYEHYGFRSSSIDPMTLMITLDDAKAALGITDLDVAP